MEEKTPSVCCADTSPVGDGGGENAKTLTRLAGFVVLLTVMRVDVQRQRLVFRWNGTEPATGAQERWYIRAISPDGSYYGTRHVAPNGEVLRIENIEGVLSEECMRQVRELAAVIAASASESEEPSGENGALGIGPIADPMVVVRYSRVLHSGTERGRAFEAIAGVIRGAL